MIPRTLIGSYEWWIGELGLERGGSYEWKRGGSRNGVPSHFHSIFLYNLLEKTNSFPDINITFSNIPMYRKLLHVESGLG